MAAALTEEEKLVMSVALSTLLSGSSGFTGPSLRQSHLESSSLSSLSFVHWSLFSALSYSCWNSFVRQRHCALPDHHALALSFLSNPWFPAQTERFTQTLGPTKHTGSTRICAHRRHPTPDPLCLTSLVLQEASSAHVQRLFSFKQVSNWYTKKSN